MKMNEILMNLGLVIMIILMVKLIVEKLNIKKLKEERVDYD